MDKFQSLEAQTPDQFNRAEHCKGESRGDKVEMVMVHSNLGVRALALNIDGTCPEFDYSWASSGALELTDLSAPCIIEIVQNGTTELWGIRCPKRQAPVIAKTSINAVKFDVSVGAIMWSSGTYSACASPIHHCLPDVDVLLHDGQLVVISKVQRCTCLIVVQYGTSELGLFMIQFDCSSIPSAGLSLTSETETYGVSEVSALAVPLQLVSTLAISDAQESAKSNVVELKEGEGCSFFSFIIAFFKKLFRDDIAHTITIGTPSSVTRDLRTFLGFRGQVSGVKIDGIDLCSGEIHASGIEITAGGSLIVNSTAWTACDYSIELTIAEVSERASDASERLQKTMTLILKPDADAKLEISIETVSGRRLFVPNSRVFRTALDAVMLPLSDECQTVSGGFVIGKQDLGKAARFTAIDDANTVLGQLIIRTSTNYPLLAATTEPVYLDRGSYEFIPKGRIGYVWFDETDMAYLPGSDVEFPLRCTFVIRENGITINVNALNASTLPKFMYSVLRTDGSVKNWHVVNLMAKQEVNHVDILGFAGQNLSVDIKDSVFNPTGAKCSVKYRVNGRDPTATLSFSGTGVLINGDSKGHIEVLPKSKYAGSAMPDKIEAIVSFAGSEVVENVPLSVSFINMSNHFANVQYAQINDAQITRGSIWDSEPGLEPSLEPSQILTIVVENLVYEAGCPIFLSGGIIVIDSDGSYAFSPSSTLDDELPEIFCYSGGPDPVILSLQKKPIYAGPFVIRANRGEKLEFALSLPKGVSVKGYAGPEGRVSVNSKIKAPVGSFKCDAAGKGKISAAKIVEKSKAPIPPVPLAFETFSLCLETSRFHCHNTKLMVYTANDVETLGSYPTAESQIPLGDGQKLLRYALGYDTVTESGARFVKCEEVSKLGEVALFVASENGAYRAWTSSALRKNLVVSYVYLADGEEDMGVLMLSMSDPSSPASLSPSLSRSISMDRSFVPKRETSPVGRAISGAFDRALSRGRSSSPGISASDRRRSMSRTVTYYMYPEGSRLPDDVVSVASDHLQKTIADTTGATDTPLYTIADTFVLNDMIFRKMPETDRQVEHILGTAGMTYPFSSHLHIYDLICTDARISVSVADRKPKFTINEDFLVAEIIKIGAILRTNPDEFGHLETFEYVLHPCKLVPSVIMLTPGSSASGHPFRRLDGKKAATAPPGPAQIFIEMKGATWTGQVNFVSADSPPLDLVLGASCARAPDFEGLGISVGSTGVSRTMTTMQEYDNGGAVLGAGGDVVFNGNYVLDGTAPGDGASSSEAGISPAAERSDGSGGGEVLVDSNYERDLAILTALEIELQDMIDSMNTNALFLAGNRAGTLAWLGDSRIDPRLQVFANRLKYQIMSWTIVPDFETALAEVLAAKEEYENYSSAVRDTVSELSKLDFEANQTPASMAGAAQKAKVQFEIAGAWKFYDATRTVNAFDRLRAAFVYPYLTTQQRDAGKSKLEFSEADVTIVKMRCEWAAGELGFYAEKLKELGEIWSGATKFSATAIYDPLSLNGWVKITDRTGAILFVTKDETPFASAAIPTITQTEHVGYESGPVTVAFVIDGPKTTYTTVFYKVCDVNKISQEIKNQYTTSFETSEFIKYDNAYWVISTQYKKPQGAPGAEDTESRVEVAGPGFSNAVGSLGRAMPRSSEHSVMSESTKTRAMMPPHLRQRFEAPAAQASVQARFAAPAAQASVQARFTAPTAQTRPAAQARSVASAQSTAQSPVQALVQARLVQTITCDARPRENAPDTRPVVQVLPMDRLGPGGIRGEKLCRSYQMNALLYVPIPASSLEGLLGSGFTLYCEQPVCKGLPGCVIFGVEGNFRLLAVGADGYKRGLCVTVDNPSRLPPIVPPIERKISNSYAIKCDFASAVSSSGPVKAIMGKDRVLFDTDLPILAKFIKSSDVKYVVLV